MSSTSSQASAVSVSGSNELGCEPSRSVRSSRSAKPSSASTGRMSPAIPMSASSPPTGSEQTAFPWMSSAEASPARTSARPERELAFEATAAAYGRSTPDLLASLDPATSSWRTSQRCLVEGWTLFSETWPRSGMTRNGTAYALPTLAPHTYGTGFGSSPTHSIPTPTASDHIERACTSTEALNFETNKSVSLDRFVKMWPTPHGMCSPNKRRAGPSGNELGRAVNQSLWMTPRASDGEKMSTLSIRRRLAGRSPDSLPDQIRSQEGTGSLNPTWVEWLMGFPIGWTDCAPSETRSSRKSRKSSDGQS